MDCQGGVLDGASFQDRWSWKSDVHQDWVDQITDDFPKVMNVIEGSRNSYGDDMGAFLCFMAVRLFESRFLAQSEDQYLGSFLSYCFGFSIHMQKTQARGII